MDLISGFLMTNVVEKDEPEDELAGEKLLGMAEDIFFEGIVKFAVFICEIISAFRVVFLLETFEDGVYRMHGVRFKPVLVFIRLWFHLDGCCGRG